MKKSLIIYNPVSGWWPTRSHLVDLIQRLSDNDYMTEVYLTKKDLSTQEVIQTLPKENLDLIVCCGGDGTLNETINGIIKSGLDIPLAYIPMGTTNDFGSTHDIPNDFNSAYNMMANGKPQSIDVGLFNSKDYFTYIACFGVFTRLTYEASQPLKNILGHLAYYIEGAKTLGDLQRSYHLRVETEDTVYEGDYIFGAVINSLSVAGTFHVPITRDQLKDGYMEVMLIKVPNGLNQISTVAGSLFRSEYEDNENMIYFKTKKIRFTSTEPIAWNIDGEFAGNEKDIVIEVKNEKLKIVC